MKKARREARAAALQVLYEADTTRHPVDEVLAYRLEAAEIPAALHGFVGTVVHGALDYRPQLDALISAHAPDWPLEQMAVVDRNILRMALWECLLSPDTPLKVAINEAVELAKLFGSDSAPGFVNGVLGALAQQADTLRAQLADDETPAVTPDAG